MNIIDLLRHAGEAVDSMGRTVAEFAEAHIEVQEEGQTRRLRIENVTHDGTNIVLVVK